MGISTHILDTTRGKPAHGVVITLSHWDGSDFALVGAGTTDKDGRVKALLPDGAPTVVGQYRILFQVAPYFARLDLDSFYPSISIDFTVTSAAENYHVPLLLNPFGFSTYRGS